MLKYAIFLMIACVFLPACDDVSQPKKAQKIRLFPDIYLSIGMHKLIYPFAGLDRYSSQTHRFSLGKKVGNLETKDKKVLDWRRANSWSKAVKVDFITLTPRIYHREEFANIPSDKCWGLIRTWALKDCENTITAVNQSLPVNRFTLVDLNELNAKPFQQVLNCAQKLDGEFKIENATNQPQIVCSSKVYGGGTTRFFTAGVRISGNLGAIWYVWEGENYKETANEMANREGRALTNFVINGLGEVEDFERLYQTACKLRRPSDSPYSRPAC